jgi:hypothetical protein
MIGNEFWLDEEKWPLSYKQTDWVWELTGRNSRLHENHRSLYMNLRKKEKTKDRNMWPAGMWNLMSTRHKNQEPTHRKASSKPRPTPRGSSNRVGPTYSNSSRIAQCCILLLLRCNPLDLETLGSWPIMPRNLRNTPVRVFTFPMQVTVEVGFGIRYSLNLSFEVKFEGSPSWAQL